MASTLIQDKFEVNGYPSLTRPDLIPPAGWRLPLIGAVSTIRNHELSPDGGKVAFIWDREGASDIYVLSSSGGWPERITVDRGQL